MEDEAQPIIGPTEAKNPSLGTNFPPNSELRHAYLFTGTPGIGRRSK